jgi:hypothetical protein
MDVINAQSTQSRFAMHAQVAEERQRFREALEERDVRCVMTTLQTYRALHIIPFADENAVSESTSTVYSHPT